MEQEADRMQVRTAEVAQQYSKWNWIEAGTALSKRGAVNFISREEK